MSTAQLSANETRRQLRYNYTLEERNAKATEMVMALNRIDATSAELDHIKADYKARLSAIESEEIRLRGCVSSGYEMRDYLCFWTFDEPRAGRKTLRKREGNEVVAEEDMTERDRQMVMDIIDAQAAAEPTAPVAGMRLALPAPADWPSSPGQVFHVTHSQEHSSAESFFSREQVSDWCDLVDDIFVAGVHPNCEIREKEDSAERATSLIDNTHDAELGRMAEWLTTGPRANIPGTEWLASEIQTYLDGIEQQEAIQREAEKARKAEEKKKARAGRKANTSGTVSVESDEGSRDDAGADSKNNL